MTLEIEWIDWLLRVDSEIESPINEPLFEYLCLQIVFPIRDKDHCWCKIRQKQTPKNVHFVIINERLCTFVTFPLYKASSITGMKFKPQFWGEKIVDRLNSKSLKNINITMHE